MSNLYALTPGIYTAYDYQYDVATGEWKLRRTMEVEAIADGFSWVDFTMILALNAPEVPIVIDPEPAPDPAPVPVPAPSPKPEPESESATTFVSIGINETQPGSTTASDDGTIILTTAGTDVWAPPDGFRFHYREAVGDLDIIVKVAEMSESHIYGKAGLMIRETLEDDAVHVYLYANVPSRERTQMSYRAVKGEKAQGEHLRHAFPMWLRLLRRGSLMTGLVSANGVDGWQKVHEFDLPMPDSVLVGLAATSHEIDVPVTAKFTGLSLTAL